MQAARGASLNASEPVSPQDVAPDPRRRLWLVMATVTMTMYVVDVVSKVLAVDRLSDGDTVELLGPLLGFHLTRNPGAAFSTGTGFTVALSLISMAAVVVILWLSRRLGSRWWAVGLGFLLAGVLGNLTDRLFRAPGPLEGHVVDFIQLPNWPIFNVADICINVAAGVIILQAFRGIGIDGARHGQGGHD